MVSSKKCVLGTGEYYIYLLLSQWDFHITPVHKSYDSTKEIKKERSSGQKYIFVLLVQLGKF